MKKVIVTGGLGFIGSNLINILEKKYFVVNIDKVTYASNFKNVNPSIKNYK
jgi:dTDP-glucose 4,6-dehydratase